MAFQHTAPRPPPRTAPSPSSSRPIPQHVKEQQERSLRSLIARVAVSDLHTDALRSLEGHWNSDVTNIRGENVLAETRAIIGLGRGKSTAAGEPLLDSNTARSVQSAFAAAYGPQHRSASATGGRSGSSTKSSARHTSGGWMMAPSAQDVIPVVHVAPTVVPRPSDDHNDAEGCRADLRGRRQRRRTRPSLIRTYSYETTASDGTRCTERREQRLVYLRRASDFDVTAPHHLCPTCSSQIVCPRPVSHCQRVL